jgi:hypothetical protein
LASYYDRRFWSVAAISRGLPTRDVENHKSKRRFINALASSRVKRQENRAVARMP